MWVGMPDSPARVLEYSGVGRPAMQWTVQEKEERVSLKDERQKLARIYVPSHGIKAEPLIHSPVFLLYAPPHSKTSPF